MTINKSERSIRTFQVDQLAVGIWPDRQGMGQAAGSEAARLLRQILRQQQQATVVFAAAPSQNEVLSTLAAESGIDWSRVTAMHMDEYVGLATDAPQSFGNYLRQAIFSRVNPGTVHYLGGAAADIGAEIERYSRLIVDNPIDVVLAGIGENGHLAFNDPGVADFADTSLVKQADLDLACRQQQVNDGCFGTLAEVPTQALTLTIPALMSARWIVCTVPGETKADAVSSTLTGDVRDDVPATILRAHPRAGLFLDTDAAARL